MEDLTIKEAADRLGLRPNTIQVYIVRELIPGVYQAEVIHHEWRIPESALGQIRRRPKAGRPPKKKSEAA